MSTGTTPPNPNDPKKPVVPPQQSVAPKPAAPPAAGAAPQQRPATPGQVPAQRPAVPGQPGVAPKPGVAPAPKPAAAGQPPAAGGPPAAGAPRPATAPGQVPVQRAPQPAQPGAAPKPAVPGQPPAQKPAVPGQPPAQRPAAPAGQKPATPGAPAGPRPAAPAGQKPATPGAPGAAAPKPGTAPAPKAAAPAKPKRNIGFVDSNTKQLGQKLVDLGFIDDLQLDSLYEDLRNEPKSLGELAVERGLITEDQLLQSQAEIFGMKIENLEEVKPNKDAVSKVPKTMAEQYKIAPFAYENNVLTVVLSDPNNLSSLDDIRNFLGIAEVKGVLASAKQIEEFSRKCYGGGGAAGGAGGLTEESIGDIIKQFESDPDLMKNSNRRETSIDLDSLEEMANSAPVRKLINMVMLIGIRDHASDLHFEPFEEEYKMRYKVDGVLFEMVPPPRHLATAIASRIKVMANLDIAERRLPQDGRIELNVGGTRIDMRVSVLPTMFGEAVVIRILDQSNVGLSLDRIGMPPDLLADFRKVIRKPNGIALVTGPTGSGKTTTLYSALSELNDIETKIITTEDPVEYEIDGLVQCPINHEIDLTFALALRAILRQDPDVILVGEIRDLETAQIAIQASLTGHLVFSTLHTNDAPSSITRLRDMGVEPFLITATVEAILAQRLVRKICTNCKTKYEPTRDQVMELGVNPDELKGIPFYFGEGCDRCNNTGNKGRTGLYELMIINDDVRDLISRGASNDQLRNYIRKIGSKSLRDCGLEALQLGITTLEEVVRETVVDD